MPVPGARRGPCMFANAQYCRVPVKQVCATVNLHDRGYGSLKILDSDAVNINTCSVLELSVP